MKEIFILISVFIVTFSKSNEDNLDDIFPLLEQAGLGKMIPDFIESLKKKDKFVESLKHKSVIFQLEHLNKQVTLLSTVTERKTTIPTSILNLIKGTINSLKPLINMLNYDIPVLTNVFNLTEEGVTKYQNLFKDTKKKLGKLECYIYKDTYLC